MRIVLGVGGGIAAYKVASLLRLFTEAGHDVTVIPTEAATRFVGVATWEALSGHPVSNSVFDDVHTVNHVRLGHEADLIVVAPATADLLARAATGQANDLLSNTLLMAGGCPVLMAPAMHTEMWQHPATQANVETLRSRGVTVLEPASGRLTGSDSGPGRLPEPEAIFEAALALAGAPAVPDDGAAAGVRRRAVRRRRARWPGSPSRSAPAAPANRWTPSGSSATVPPASRAWRWPPPPATPVPGSGCWPPTWTSRRRPASTSVKVETALELREAALHAAADSDVIIMAAAVADFRPADVSGTKIKKRDDVADPVITLVRNPDILRELVEVRDAASRTPADRRLRGRDRRRRRRRPGLRRSQAAPQGLRPAGGQPRGPGQGLRRGHELRSHPFPLRLRTPRGVGFQIRRRGCRD